MFDFQEFLILTKEYQYINRHHYLISKNFYKKRISIKQQTFDFQEFFFKYQNNNRNTVKKSTRASLSSINFLKYFGLTTTKKIQKHLIVETSGKKN